MTYTANLPVGLVKCSEPLYMGPDGSVCSMPAEKNKLIGMAHHVEQPNLPQLTDKPDFSWQLEQDLQGMHGLSMNGSISTACDNSTPKIDDSCAQPIIDKVVPEDVSVPGDFDRWDYI